MWKMLLHLTLIKTDADDDDDDDDEYGLQYSNRTASSIFKQNFVFNIQIELYIRFIPLYS